MGAMIIIAVFFWVIVYLMSRPEKPTKYITIFPHEETTEKKYIWDLEEEQNRIDREIKTSFDSSVEKVRKEYPDFMKGYKGRENT